jgi:hypothetical protein
LEIFIIYKKLVGDSKAVKENNFLNNMDALFLLVIIERGTV